jgi:dTDP-4-amino-4,6-dideoxygalactose transaminase
MASSDLGLPEGWVPLRNAALMADSSFLFTAYPLEDFRRRASDILHATTKVMQGGHYILGSEVERFEEEWAAWCGAAQAIGVANGTDAIELLLRGHGIGKGDLVAVPSHTAVASISAIRRTGAAPVYVDLDPETFTLRPDSLELALAGPAGSRLKAVLAVHLYGHPADWAALSEVCGRHGLILLEDCAQAHGATWQGRRVGALGQGAAFSFYPTKNLGAIGDGGAITTNDAALAERIREIRQYGWRERYISAVEGVNSRLDELQAAILRVKLADLAGSVAARQSLAVRYREGLAGLPLIRLPVVREHCTHAFHLHVIRSPRRDDLMAFLLQRGIPVALHYPAAVHQQPGYSRFADQAPALEETERAVREILTLPLHPWLSPQAVDLVIDSIRAWTPAG